jgi:hypothetical protein
MTKKYWVALASLVFVLLACLWMTRLPNTEQAPGSATRSETIPISPPTTKVPPPRPSNESREEAPIEVESQSRYEMTAANVDFDPVAEAKSKEVQPYRLRGGAGLGKIVDSQGKVVLESGSESGMHIFGCEVSPNGKLVLVQGGDGKNLILDPNSGRRWLLPHQPPNENMFAFGSWYWIDDDTLLAASGEKLSVRDAQLRANAEEPGASRSRLYLFKISRQQLTTIQLPKDFGNQVFSIAQVSSTGSVHLVRQEANASATADLGWFKIRPK